MFLIELKNVQYKIKNTDSRIFPDNIGMNIDDISITNAIFQFISIMESTFDVKIEEAEVYVDDVFMFNSLLDIIKTNGTVN